MSGLSDKEFAAAYAAWTSDPGDQRCLRIWRARKTLEEITDEIYENSPIANTAPLDREAIRHEVDNTVRLYCALLEAQK
jgi:hypothetical protein